MHKYSLHKCTKILVLTFLFKYNLNRQIFWQNWVIRGCIQKVHGYRQRQHSWTGLQLKIRGRKRKPSAYIIHSEQRKNKNYK